MNLVSAILCESANTLPDGRVNLLGGGINDVSVKQFPVFIKICVVLRFDFYLVPKGEHTVQVKLIDGDGQGILKPLNMKCNVPEKQRFANFVIDVGRLKIPAPGAYSFEIMVDGNHCQSLPLDARQMRPHPGNAQ